MANNRYLRDRIDRRRGRRDRSMDGRDQRGGDRRYSQDGRNPYGSRGGYVSSRSGRDRAMEEMDYRANNSRYDSRYDGRDNANYGGNDGRHMEQYRDYPRPMQYEVYGMINSPHRYEDYRGYDRAYDGNYDQYSSDYKDGEEEYKQELKEFAEKLKSKDIFHLSKQMVVKKAEETGVKFEEFSEDEFYFVYLMMISIHKNIANDPHTYIKMAKQFFEDDDIKVSPSEKLCIYFYEIIKGESQEE
ncbi:MAG: hypothetical protein NC182_01580 [Prevotella sp.]|nr:hypothetical protein [Staphylococcus sp.]MCM1349873.1 hypothetical protein [Prevotella sp.]